MNICIIIGTGTGVSEAVAQRFGTSGYRIGLISRSAANLADLAERLSTVGLSVEWAEADAGKRGVLETAIEKLQSEMGSCDVFIYNAAVLQSGTPLDISTDQIALEMEVNVLGAHRAVKAVVPAMIGKGRGAILFTGGGLSLEPFPEWTSLALGKAALRSLAISLFKDLKPRGMHVAVLAICGIVAPDGPYDPKVIAEEYWRVANNPNGIKDREVIFQPAGTDPFYNDPEKRYLDVSVMPEHARNFER